MDKLPYQGPRQWVEQVALAGASRVELEPTTGGEPADVQTAMAEAANLDVDPLTAMLAGPLEDADLDHVHKDTLVEAIRRYNTETGASLSVTGTKRELLEALHGAVNA